MDTNKLKRFATEARSALVTGVTQRFFGLGFSRDGSIREEPRLFEGGATFMGETVSTEFYEIWQSLKKAVDVKGLSSVIEEAAYTWFNRMVALRILAKNGLIAPVLDYESDDVRVPVIVGDARQGRLPQMNELSENRLRTLLDDDSKTSEQFRILIIAFCHSTPLIFRCFGSFADYTELLLPANILSEGGFVDMLNSTEYITEEDYLSPELIGWLYQFYISEKKDEVFASFSKGHKAEADDIPAATQIFTPNWIVKYMVQNTIGRIYLDNNPSSSIRDDMKYLVENEGEESEKAILKIDDLHDLTCADLACGSGHILNECFDILFKIYTEEGYSRRQAIEDIFKYNITGIDIDTRAKQLATFALMLKACQKDRSFLDGRCIPNVLDMPVVDRYTFLDLSGHFQCAYQLSDCEYDSQEIVDAFDLMKNDRELGSIMIFNISERTRAYMQKCVDVFLQEPKYGVHLEALINAYMIILALTRKYAAIVMNPPYMSGSNMNSILSKYVKDNYESGKIDLFASFMILAIDRIVDNGRYGMINMQSWMFLSSFEGLRKNIINSCCIESLLHLGPHTFDELSGEVVQNVAFVMQNTISKDRGDYFRLVNGRKCSEKENMFLSVLSGENTELIFHNILQSQFEKIPGNPIGYWLSSTMLSIFESSLALSCNARAVAGIQTGNNDRFVRSWFEISYHMLITKDYTFDKKWYPYNKGGGFRKWYGNQELVVNWEDNGKELKSYKGSTLRNQTLYFKPSISWSLTSSVACGFRYNPNAALFDINGMSLFPNSDIDYFFFLSALNTKVFQKINNIINPTLATQCGDVARFPTPKHFDNDELIRKLGNDNVVISRQDWDAHETSWDFKRAELIRMQGNCGENCTCMDMLMSINDADGFEDVPTNGRLLSDCYKAYVGEWGRKFNQLRYNEYRLNKEFIDIYGLQEEMTPDVPLDEITILQQGEISIEDDKIVWHADVIIKQLLSYAVGCMMGRYSLDKPGLILANQGDGIDEYKELVPNSRFEIDDDGIIPMMSSATEFTDVVTKRFKSWLALAFSEDKLVENLNFIEESLGKQLDDYFVKDFWNDHKKMYQNKPIYWLFSSKKGAFQCLAYMHRMNPYTAEKIRTKYLLPHIEWLVAKQQEMESRSSELSSAERRQLDSLYKQIEECREYHDRLHVIADQQIAFDLDDGVAVNYAKFGDVLRKIK